MSTASALPTADFSHDTWWISLIKAVIIVALLLTGVLMALWVERRGLGKMQTREGPNVLGPFGLFQAVADAIKLVLKEDIQLKGADRVLYMLAPGIAAFCAFMVLAVIPMGPAITNGADPTWWTPMQLTDMPVAVLYILAITALGVYGIVLGGWSSNSTYPLLGAVRSSAQVISYELSMGLALVSVFLVSGSMATSQIVDAQTNVWWAISLLPAFVIYVISMVAEVNRLPFDLPEAEGELVAGHSIEFSSMKFAWFYLAEYVNMFNVSAVATTLFLGGWRIPFLSDHIVWWAAPVVGFLVFWLKVWACMFVMIWMRGTLLRVRYDQLMNLGWKILIPAALVWLVAVTIIQGVRQFSDLELWQLLAVIAGLLLVVMIVTFLLPEKKEPEPEPDEPEPFDAFAGGFPVPPLPGQTLPPSPRADRRRAAQAGEPVVASSARASAAANETAPDATTEEA
ncbi:NADH-quinone oxidoreductase subunit NuoH [Georgenia sp. Z1491]|uniref:NADH-quinone oxidoreductase subunit NuoH n=1 Tax=Georgenia sp. Z1491 TaxID=3416707 RepID=UPI003CFAA690